MKKYGRRSKKIGSSPGSLIYTGKREAEPVKFKIFDYDESSFVEKDTADLHEIIKYKKTAAATWLNIDGIHKIDVVENIGKIFNIHPLTLEDILHTEQRPKADDYGTYIYLVLRMFTYDKTSKKINNEQLSIVLGDTFIVTFQENHGDVFDGVRERLRGGKGNIRIGGAPYLAYALIDSVVDSYFYVLDSIGDDLEKLEEDLLENPDPVCLQTLHKLRREVILLRKSVWPLREVISQLQRRDSPLIGKNIEIFLRDVYDHTIQVIDTIESYRDIVAGLIDIYLSGINNRMNEVMKVLTIIATIFIPLTFLAGVYGMNFKYFPELNWEWMYPDAFWLGSMLIAGGMLYYFKRKHWL